MGCGQRCPIALRYGNSRFRQIVADALERRTIAGIYNTPGLIPDETRSAPVVA
jgi:hypothetical protein